MGNEDVIWMVVHQFSELYTLLSNSLERNSTYDVSPWVRRASDNVSRLYAAELKRNHP